MVEKDKSQKNELVKTMEEHIKKVMVDLRLTVKDFMHPLIKTTHNLKARFALVEPPFIKAIEVVRDFYDPRLADVLSEVHDIHMELFKDLLDVVFDLEPKAAKLYSNFRDRNLKAYQEASNNAGAAEKLYKENQEIISSWEEDKVVWNAEKNRLNKEIAALEAENKKYLQMILKRTKNKAEEVVEVSSLSPMHHREPSTLGQLQPISEQEMKNIGRGQHIGDINVRVLSLKQMNEVIADIYESKLKCDQKYIESKLPRETMEQHMYTFLNTKYGLKSLIIEWATAIVNAIKQFNSADNNVAVFGKILRNECDEEFRFVQAQVKTTISELLKMLVKSKYPYKNKQEVNDLLQAKMEGYLSEDEVHEIVKYMYSKEDAAVILDSVKVQLTRGASLAKEYPRLTQPQTHPRRAAAGRQGAGEEAHPVQPLPEGTLASRRSSWTSS